MELRKECLQVSIILPDHSELVLFVKKSDRGQVLLDVVFDIVKCKETKYYGLQFPYNGMHAMKWLDPTKLIRKQLKRGYPQILYYKIKYFVTDLNSIREKSTLYHLFIQVKLDILEHKLTCSTQTAALLASYAVQSEIGDYTFNETIHQYLKQFLPNQTETFEEEVKKLHKNHRGLTPAQAEINFLMEAAKLSTYGVDIHHGKLPNGDAVEIGVATDGISIVERNYFKKKYRWSKITKISFKRKMFHIQLHNDGGKPDSSLIVFLMVNYRACKNLWKNCVDCHSFYRKERETSLCCEKNKIIIPVKTGGLGSSFSGVGNGNVKYRHDVQGNTVYDHHKSTSTRILNCGEPIINEDNMDTIVNKESRRKSAPPSVTLAVKSSSLDTAYVQVSSSTDSHHGIRDLLPNTALESRSQPGINTSESPPKHSEHDGSENILWPCILPCNLSLVRLKPNSEGRFGFNIKGGHGQNMPIIISKIEPRSPAEKCVPTLKKGDELLQINGRASGSLSHNQAVHLIQATLEKFAGELTLLIRQSGVCRNDYYDSNPMDAAQDDIFPHSKMKNCENMLQVSMMNLENLVKSGKDVLVFDRLHRSKPSLTIIDSKLVKNISKNRYRDISPYDATRVKLCDWSTDYINASHIYMSIPNTGILNHYIAGQGPLPNTSGDFWAMVKEQGAVLIVMVTTTREHGIIKCHQYWPSIECSMQYNDITVKSISEKLTPSCALREFEMTFKNGGDERLHNRNISHIQYTAWPDHGVPDDSNDFLDFLLCVRQKKAGTVNVPSIVHCSAGIGRTGVMIATETALLAIEANQPVCMLQITKQMRDQRPLMIQTKEQFRFACQAVLQAYDKDSLN